MILERQVFHLDQLRYLEQRAKHDAQLRLVSGGQLPPNLPPGFEVGGPPQPQPQVQVANVTAPSAAASVTSVSLAPPTTTTLQSNTLASANTVTVTVNPPTATINAVPIANIPTENSTS